MFRRKKIDTTGRGDYLDELAKRYKISYKQALETVRGVGIDPKKVPDDRKELLEEVIASRTRNISFYRSDDKEYLKKLEYFVSQFDEIYVDTAPIIQMDWFLHFASDISPILKRHKKRMIVLEKTMEELWGLKGNPEKDFDVRVRALTRPDLLRFLARKGSVRIGDTGSEGIADDHLVSLFEKIGGRESVMLVTQDRGLSERIVHLNHKNLQKPLSPLPQSFWERVWKKPLRYPEHHRMIVCKLVEEGFLKRCYICPDCMNSYYDEVDPDCDGYLPDSHCILKHKENRQRDEQKQKRLEQIEKKRAEREAELEKIRNRPTVGDLVAVKRRKLCIAAALALLVLLIVVLLVI